MVIHRGLVADLQARPGTPASTWMRAWLRRAELDRQLAEGGNPTTDALRVLRARQLTRGWHRRGLATALRRLVAEACGPPLLYRPPVPPLNRRAVQDGRAIRCSDWPVGWWRRRTRARGPSRWPATWSATRQPGVHRSHPSDRGRPGGNGARRNRPSTTEVRAMRLLQRLLRREPPQETKCPRCGVPAPIGDLECTACGWDLRESYHDPVSGAHREPAR